MGNTSLVCSKEPDVSLLRLDDHLLDTILKKAAIGAASHAGQLMAVCRRFHLSLLRLATATTINDDTALLDLSRCPKLACIRVKHCRKLPWPGSETRPHSHDCLQHLTALHHELCGPLEGRDLEAVFSLAALQQLEFRSCRFTSSCAFAGLQRLNQLRHLDLVELPADAPFEMSHLAGLSQLTSLQLQNCPQVADHGLSHLSRLLALQHLKVSECRQVFGPGLASLTGLASSLLHLDLSLCCNLRDEGLTHVAKLTSLQYLSLAEDRNLTNRGFVKLAALTALTSLNLRRTELTGAGFRGLSSLVKLLHLNLGSCDVGDSDVLHFAPFSSLKVLDLTCVSITHTGLPIVRRCLPDGVQLWYEHWNHAGHRELYDEMLADLM